jgi:DNA-directed RNA polymerase subunit RPC12/RpoP
MKECKWKLEDKDLLDYETECGELHYFEAGGIKENHYKYCPYCGKKILEVNK